MTEDPRNHRDDPNDAHPTHESAPADAPPDASTDDLSRDDTLIDDTASQTEPVAHRAEFDDDLFADDDPLGPPPAAMYDDPPAPPDGMYDDRPTPPHAPPPPGPSHSGPTHPPSYTPMAAPDEHSVPSESRNLAALAHLSALAAFVGIPSFVGPLVIWLLQKDRNAFVAEAAREALNFNLSLLIYGIAAAILAIVTIGLALIVVVPLVLVAVVVWLVVTVLAAMRVSNGRMYRYPLTIRLVS